MSILNGLNDEQRKAAEQLEGPLLILAGAGSGKTRTVTYRIAHMVLEKGINPYEILAVTFTNKASKEMKERVESLIGLEAKKVTVSTFHSFGVKLLRMYGTKLGYDSNFNIYDGDDQKKVISAFLKKFVSPNKQLTPGMIVSKISKFKEDGRTPEEVMKDAYNIDSRFIAEIYGKYSEELTKNNAMDFSDLLINTNRLLDIKEILEKVQNRYKYIMVDEYQDTNNIQYEIVRKIASKDKNICVVGDEDQSIYGFRGANIENILNFEGEYPEATVIKLEQNYRSTKNILNAANSVIKRNTTSRGKTLWSDKETGGKIIVFNADNAKGEAEYVVEKIIQGVGKGRSYKDYTILYRTNAQSRLFEEVFMKYRINYKIFGGMQFYQRTEVKDVISYMRVVNNPKDSLSLLRILNVPKRKLGAKSLEKLEKYSEENNISLFETLGEIENVSISSSLKVTIKRLYKMFKSLIADTEVITASEIYDTILEKINYFDYLKNLDDKWEARIQNVEELRASIQELENSDEHSGFLKLGDFLEQTALVAATDTLDDDNYVKLMTIHNSKGLEFPIVFLVGAEDELFPSSKADVSDDDLEEERRLCYVAITRAEKQLYITHATERMIYGKASYMRDRSRFIGEIDPAFMKYDGEENELKQRERQRKKLSGKNIITANDLKGEKDSKYHSGMKITHKRFGNGKIIGIEGKKRLVIRFKDGEKKLPLILADKFIEIL